MASGAQLRPFEVDKRLRCGERHRFALAVRAAQQGVAVFGGIQAQEIAFICPKTKLAFTKLVTPEEKTEIIGPADPSQVAPVAVEAAGATLSVTNPASGEFQDW